MDTKTTLKYASYTRKSTEGEDRQMLSHEDQERDLLRIEKTENLNVIERFTGKERGESKSAHKRGRPIFSHIMQQIEVGKINALLVWHPNRIARNAFDGGWVITMMDEGKLLEVRTPNGVYRNTSNDKFMLQLEFNMAKKSSDDNGDAVKRGIRTKLKQGWYPSNAPFGYLNTVTHGKGMNTILKDPERFDQVKEMWKLMLTGRYTPPQILDVVNNEWKLRTRKGNKIARSTIYRIFNNDFYSGYFECPKGSGEWYTGKHEPMVTREEFERVQALLGNTERPRPLTRRFDFTGIMKCGHCGASITAEAKIKRQKNGNVHNYVYYRCTKRIDSKCPEKTVELSKLNEQVDLIIQGLTISDKFRDWAIKYLHEVRKDEAKSFEKVLTSKQKRVTEITKQLDALLLRYTSPNNCSGELISDNEYKSAKNKLLEEKRSLEEDLASQSLQQEKWMEFSEKTFNFARYASIWFLKGDMETRRAIFSALGSNLSLKDRKVSICLRKPFKLLFDNLADLEKEMLLVRTSEKETNKGQIVSFAPACPTGRRMWDSNPREHFCPGGLVNRCLQPLGQSSNIFTSFK
jgi:site-specific DNA recombinase